VTRGSRFLLGVLAGGAAAVAVVLVARVVVPDPAGPTGPLGRQVTEFGAVPDDGRDDTDAIDRALLAMRPGDTLTFPPGRYEHDRVLVVAVPGARLTGAGATLVATAERASAVRVDADDVVVDGLTLTVAATTRRWESPEQHKVWVSGHRGVVLRDITITGSAAAGIFVDGAASGFRIERARVSDTRADGIHITGGAHDGQVVDPVIARTGDDGVAVVSYERDTDTCSAITVTHPQVLGTTWGRGLSVVGGRDVRFNDVQVEDSNAAAIYIAVEGAPYFTRPVDRVSVDGGVLDRSNNNADIDHGAVVVYSGRPDSRLADVRIANIALQDTRPTASQDVSVISTGTAPTDLAFDHVEVTGGPGTVFGGNAPRASYRVD
jgi:hypothetical protein